MKTATVHLRSTTTYSQSSYFTTEKPTKMKSDEFDRLYWREHAHVVKAGPMAGHVFIPAQQFKNALVDAAKYLGLKIKGRGNATYSKHFAAGVIVPDPLVLPIKVEDLEHEVVWCSADGKPGGSTKVQRTFPVVHQWAGDVSFIVVDDAIDDEIFEQHLRHAGYLIGIGRWRPIKNGSYGRFTAEKISWT